MNVPWLRGTNSKPAAGVAVLFAVLMAVACGSSSEPSGTDTDTVATPAPSEVSAPTPTVVAETAPVVANADGTATAAVTSVAVPTGDVGDPPSSDNPGLSLSDQPLTLRGIGRLEIGMTLDEAIEATGLSISVRDDSGGGEACQYAQVVGDAESPWLMLVGPADGFDPLTIVRIELAGSSSTLSGIQIGSSKAEVLAAYGDRIEVTPHKYTFAEGGEYLTFVPADAVDADYRLIFETLNDKVTEIRSGLLPAVEWVEGCL